MSFSQVKRRFRRARGKINTKAIVYEAQLRTMFLGRMGAPRGKTGKGPHGRIARSLQSPPPLTTRAYGGGKSSQASVFSRYGPAIFTNEGTGKHGDNKRPYPIRRGDITFIHPGIRGNAWFGQAFEEGAELQKRRMGEVMSEVLDGIAD